MPDINGVVWLIEAFYELNTTRQYTMGGAAAIPIDKIWEWSDRNTAPIWFPNAVMSIDVKYLEDANNG